MTLDNLHLDGIAGYRAYLEASDYQSPSAFKCGKADLMRRIFAVFEAAFLVVITAFRQTLRGTIFLVSGLLTCNTKFIKFAFADYLSVLVQSIAIPVFGIMTVAFPSQALKLAEVFCKEQNPNMKKLDVPLRESIKNSGVIPSYKCPQYIDYEPNFVANMLVRLTAPIQAVAHLIEGVVTTLFTAQCTKYTLLAPLLFLYVPLRILFNAESSAEGLPGAAQVHGIACRKVNQGFLA